MRKYIFAIFATAIAVLHTGCTKNSVETVADRSVVGNWHLSSWDGESQTDFDVYMELNEDTSFNLYQKVETSTYKRYSGTFSADNGVLSGTYSDGIQWGSSYSYEVSADGETLTMTSDSGNGIVSVYTRIDLIPEDVINSPQSKYGEIPDVERFL